MKYLKLFESNKVDIDQISNDIVKYTKEYGLFNYELDEMIRIGYPYSLGDTDGYYEEDLSPDIVKQAILYIKKVNKRDYQNILDWHSEISYILTKDESMTIEEIEDLFLDMDEKISVNKFFEEDNIYFKVEISNIPSNNIQSINNRVWSTITKRIPSNYKIFEYKIEINRKLSSDDDLILMNTYDLFIKIIIESGK